MPLIHAFRGSKKLDPGIRERFGRRLASRIQGILEQFGMDLSFPVQERDLSPAGDDHEIEDVARNCCQPSFVWPTTCMEPHFRQRKLSSEGKERNVAPIHLSASHAVEVDLRPPRKPLDPVDGSHLRIKGVEGARWNHTPHRAQELLLERNEPVKKHGDALLQSHALTLVPVEAA